MKTILWSRNRSAFAFFYTALLLPGLTMRVPILELRDARWVVFEANRDRFTVGADFVAAVQTLGGLLVIVGTTASLDIDIHEALSHELHHLAQHVDIGAFVGQFK